MEIIEPSSNISEIMKNYPCLTDYLIDLRLCSFGHDSSLAWTVSRVAQEKGIDLIILL